MRRSRRKLKAGVIGTGMGRYHMEGFATHPQSELTAVCDLNVPEAQAFADKYGAKHVFRDYRKMIAMEELDIVAVATPNYLHAKMTIAALKAGKDVLCEKPIAIRLADAEAMVRAAKRRGKRLMINVGMRFDPVHEELRQRVGRGELGEVYYARSHWIRRKGIPFAVFPPTGEMARGEWFVKKRQAGGGALIDIGVHLFDLAWWLIGSPRPTSVLASMYSELLPDRLASPYRQHSHRSGPIRSLGDRSHTSGGTRHHNSHRRHEPPGIPRTSLGHRRLCRAQYSRTSIRSRNRCLSVRRSVRCSNLRQVYTPCLQ